MTRCKNCNKQFNGKYCNNCGQKKYSDADKDFLSIFKEIFHFLTHFEGTFFTTLKAIYLHPAKLSCDYCEGIRKKYFKPVSFYFLIVALYLLFPIFQGLNTSLQFQKKMFAGELISKQIEHKIRTKNITEDQFSEKYTHYSEKVSKILLFLFIPFSGFLIYFLFYKQKKLAFDLTIYSTEINIFFITTFFLFFPVLFLLFHKVFTHILPSEKLTVIIVEVAFILYLSIFFRRIFQNKWGLIFFKSMVFAFLHMVFLLTIYRFLLFEISYFFI